MPATPDTPVTLRDATPDDAGPIADLITSLGYRTTASEMRDRLVDLLAHPDYVTLVATAGAGAEVVGLIGFRIGPLYERSGVSGHIMAIAVDGSHQGRGCGRVLLEAAEARVRERGGVEMIVNSGNHRTAAHGFYRAIGFEATGKRFIKHLEPPANREGPY